MKREIRVPKQKRSIEKKMRIVEAAYKLFNEQGYMHTNTALIAKEAGLSTGCLYDYFVDKEDIFIEAVKLHNTSMNQYIHSKLVNFPMDMPLCDLIEAFIQVLLEVHNHSLLFHIETMSLSLSKPEIRAILNSYQNEDTVTPFCFFFQKRGIMLDHPKEKVFLFLNTADQVCHDLLFGKMKEIDQDVYIKECAKMLERLILS